VTAWIPLALAAAGTAYLALACACLVAFARRPLPLASEFEPSISVLKPIAGMEPELYENLSSFCDQEYPDFEVVFCAHDAADPALGIAERVRRDHPGVKTRVAIGHNPAMINPKIANLAKPGAEPQGEIVVIADSDVRVGPSYLRALAAAFESQRIGAATCLYAARPLAGAAGRLGALFIEDGFAPSVLVALAIGKLRFCLGATMAVRRSVLERIGGLQVLGAHLADDHTLGELVAAAGYEIELSRYVVRTVVPETTLRELWPHELRWARTNLALAPAGWFFSFLMYAVPLAVIALAVSRNLGVGVPLLALAFALRLVLHALARRTFGVTRASDWYLLPVRDVLSLALWAASLAGRTVRWRSQVYDAGAYR
jgi:ceramide glucosyltransferase